MSTHPLTGGSARRLLRWKCRRCPAAGWAYSLAEVRAHVATHTGYDTTTVTRLSIFAGTNR